MSSTVPADLPRMFRPEPKLAAVPVQPTAKTRETLPAARTWSFIDRHTSQLREVTCLPGCSIDHSQDRETPTHPDDVWCLSTEIVDLWLPVSSGGQKPDETRVLSVSIRKDPFSKNVAQRVPHAVVEILEDSFIEPLDPDGLAAVILQLEGQLKQMRDVHAQLTALRAQGRVQL